MENRLKPAHEFDYVPTCVPWSTELTQALRFKFFANGVLLPVVCLIGIACGLTASTDEPWQSGTFGQHLVVFLSAPTIFFFYPLFAYSIVCLSVWCWDPRKYSRLFWVQAGLQTGVLLTLGFNFLLFPVTFIASPVFAVLMSPAVAALTMLAQPVVREKFSIRQLMLITAAIAVLANMFSDFEWFRETLVGTLWTVTLLVMGAAPTTGLITFLRTSVAAFHLWDRSSPTQQPSPQDSSAKDFLIGLTGTWLVWFGLLYAAIRHAIELQAIEYAKLPTSNPNCYISSAAAHGHPKLVRVIAEQPNLGKVNLQMRRLKFLEFALASTCPHAHRLTRRLYNRVGPHLAKICGRNVWFADLTFLCLLPLEWSTVFLQKALHIPDSVIAKIYRQ